MFPVWFPREAPLSNPSVSSAFSPALMIFEAFAGCAEILRKAGTSSVRLAGLPIGSNVSLVLERMEFGKHTSSRITPV